MYKHKEKGWEKQARSLKMEKLLYEFLDPLLHSLNQRIDRRLVATFLGLAMAILVTPGAEMIFCCPTTRLRVSARALPAAR